MKGLKSIVIYVKLRSLIFWQRKFALWVKLEVFRDSFFVSLRLSLHSFFSYDLSSLGFHL
jgi:hypothetical protein